jgi:methanesulfonate monooxygenase small subunit
VNAPGFVGQASESVIDHVRSRVYRSCLLLDREDFNAYLALWTEELSYCITTFSPDLKKEMVWLDLDRTELTTLFNNLKHHVRMQGILHRAVCGNFIEPAADGREVVCTSSIWIAHTGLDGVSKLFAVARYHDVFDVSLPYPLLKRRDVRLDTRELGAGSHVPL